MATGVYVIMPVGSDRLHAARRVRIDAATLSLGLSPYHPLDHRSHGAEISADAIRAEIIRCAVVLVDLSFERPSCYYELGVAHGVGLPVAVIAEVGTMIHQTADRWSVTYYDSFDDLEIQVSDVLRTYAPALSR